MADNLTLMRALQYASTCGVVAWLRPREPSLGGGVAASGAVATRLGLSGVPVAAETIALHTIFELMRQTGARVLAGLRLDHPAVKRDEPAAVVRDDAVARVGHAWIDAEDDHVHAGDSARSPGRLPAAVPGRERQRRWVGGGEGSVRRSGNVPTG